MRISILQKSVTYAAPRIVISYALIRVRADLRYRIVRVRSSIYYV